MCCLDPLWSHVTDVGVKEDKCEEREDVCLDNHTSCSELKVEVIAQQTHSGTNSPVNMTEEIPIGTDILHHGWNVSVNGSLHDTFFIDPTLDHAIKALTISSLFIVMISLGCTMEIPKIKHHIRKPKGVAIAIFAQFGIMPLTAFCLTKLLQLEPIKAVSVLICGCCPGGNWSNVFSLALNGDMNLSIVMTTCSTFAALGLMPLLLFLYCQSVPGLENAIPYVGIVTSLTLTLVPCSTGIGINYYKPNYSAVIKKGGLIILMICVVTLSILSAIAVGPTIRTILSPDLLIPAVVMPLAGYILGYLMSIMCRLDSKCSRTISMETGCQNIQLCATILKVAFPSQVIGAMFLFPLVCLAFQCIEALLVVLFFRCYQTLKPSAEEMSRDAKREEGKQTFQPQIRDI